MKQSIIESLTFLSCARKAISSMVKLDEKMDKTNQKELSNYIINEASDYEIMYFLVKETLPKTKFNPVNEEKAFNTLKVIIHENIELFGSFMTKDDIKTLMFEVNSVQPYGLSSAKPILEFQMNQLQEAGLSPALRQGAIKASKLAAKNKFADGNYVGAAKSAAKSAKHTVIANAQNAAGKVKTAGTSAVNSVKQAASSAAGKIKSGASGAATTAKQGVKNFTSRNSLAANALKKGAVGAAWRQSTTGGKVAAGVGIAAALAAITWAGNRAYQRYFSAAGKACKGKSGADRTNCVRLFKNKALQAKIAALSAGKSKCSGSKNSQKCIAKLNSDIAKVKSKMR